MSNHDIAVSSRVRLARNSSAVPFPNRMTQAQRQQLWQQVCSALPDNYTALAIEPNTQNEASALAEQHWISPEFARVQGAHGVLYDKAAGLSVMVNEEDHLRIQALVNGYRLDDALAACQTAERQLSQALPFATDDKLGYLTSCPTNLGTAMRASVMLHLPALTQSGQMRFAIEAVSKLGLTVRGFYGEGSQALGGYYQLSNQVSLGLSEQDILLRLHDTAASLMDKEAATRTAMHHNARLPWEDRVYRAYGQLTNARLLNFDEALSGLSLLRMGLLEQLPAPCTVQQLDALTAQIGPATLSQQAQQPLNAMQRDAYRAQLLRDALSQT